MPTPPLCRPQGEAALWEMFEDSDCPSLDNAAVAETEDLSVCKKAIEKGQLKGKGIGCFVMKGGYAYEHVTPSHVST